MMNRSLFYSSLTAVLVFAGSVSGQTCPHAQQQTAQMQQAVSTSTVAYAAEEQATEVAPADIVDTAVSAGSFKTLVAAVQAASLVETLKGDGPFTVFAPTDDAFAKVPAETLQSLLKPENKEQLQAILTYHVVAGKVMAADVVNLQAAKTVNGAEVKVSNTPENGVMINNAKVVKTDIECGNGVIHVIDTVLMPK